MKIRSGFVSNSSSSSFVFTLKKTSDEVCECCKRPFEENLLKQLDDSSVMYGDDSYTEDITFATLVEEYYLDPEVLVQICKEHSKNRPDFYIVNIENSNEQRLNLLTSSKQVKFLVRLE